MKLGDIVRLIAVPPHLKDEAKLHTRSLFEKCLGEKFPIVGFETVEGLPYRLVRLDVGHVVGKEPFLETIWVEPEYLHIEDSK